MQASWTMVRGENGSARRAGTLPTSSEQTIHDGKHHHSMPHANLIWTMLLSAPQSRLVPWSVTRERVHPHQTDNVVQCWLAG